MLMILIILLLLGLIAMLIGLYAILAELDDGRDRRGNDEKRKR